MKSGENHSQQLGARLAVQLAPYVRRIPVWLWLVIAALFFGSLAFASRVMTGTESAQPGNLDMVSLGLDMTVKLAIVIGLIYLGVYLLRKGKGWLPGASQRQVRVIESTRLAPRQALHLVEIGGHRLLIGATDQNLSLLAELATQEQNAPADEPVKDNGLGNGAGSIAISSPFAQVLHQIES